MGITEKLGKFWGRFGEFQGYLGNYGANLRILVGKLGCLGRILPSKVSALWAGRAVNCDPGISLTFCSKVRLQVAVFRVSRAVNFGPGVSLTFARNSVFKSGRFSDRPGCHLRPGDKSSRLLATLLQKWAFFGPAGLSISTCGKSYF